jgi:LPXTG-motif cell wall-anchored protein
MTSPRRLVVALAGLSALLATSSPAAAVPAGFTPAAGVEVVEVVAIGGTGGTVQTYPDSANPGGGGCMVSASIAVADTTTITWRVGSNGVDAVKDTDISSMPGGDGDFPGGDGGGVFDTFSTNTFTGGSGGGATTVSIDGQTSIVAAGGGGASAGGNGGRGCADNQPEGGRAFGIFPPAQGASTASAGGERCTATGSPTPRYGTDGNSADHPTAPGRGGDGASGRYIGPGGGGGGGGISGGGGGCGAANSSSSASGGGAGLSGAPEPTADVAAPTFSSSDTSGSVVIWWITVDPPLDLAFSVGAPASATPTVAGFAATDGAVPTSRLLPSITWTVSPELPEGLELDPTTGVISGTPAEAAAGSWTLTASQLDVEGDARMRTSTSIDLSIIDDGTVLEDNTPTTNTTQDTAAATTLPTTGDDSSGWLLALGLAALIVGIGIRRVGIRRAD